MCELVDFGVEASSPLVPILFFYVKADQRFISPQGSLRKEFPVNIGGSDVCFFCRKRVYVMERLSAEGKFFHRSCFKCDYCGTTLRLSSYAFDVEDGKILLHKQLYVPFFFILTTALYSISRSALKTLRRMSQKHVQKFHHR